MLNENSRDTGVRVRHSADYRPPLQPCAPTLRRPQRSSVTLATMEPTFRLDAPAFQPSTTEAPRYAPLTSTHALLPPPPPQPPQPTLEPYDGAYFAARGTQYAEATAPLFGPGRNSAPARTTPQATLSSAQGSPLAPPPLLQQTSGDRARRTRRNRGRGLSMNFSAPGATTTTTSGGETATTTTTTTTTSGSSSSSSTSVSPTSQQQQQQQRQGTLKPELYKTELCRKYAETGSCRYGAKCQFAHGEAELRPVQRHPLYKTEPCRMYHQLGRCNYGPRCRFIHQSPDEGPHPARPAPAPQRHSTSALTSLSTLTAAPVCTLLGPGTPPAGTEAPLVAAFSQPTSPESAALGPALTADVEREQERRLFERLGL